MFKYLISIACSCALLAVSVPSFAQFTASRTATGVLESTVAGLPANPPSGAVRIVTDGNASDDCDTGLGSTRVLCNFDGVNWTGLSGGLSAETQTLDQAFDQGKVIDGANSEANYFRVGTSTNYFCIFSDAGNGLYLKPEPLATAYWRCWTNLTCVIRDEEGAADILTIDPDAASTLAMWQLGAAYRWKKSIYFGAGSLSTDGTQCAAPAEATPVASGPKLWTIVCADNDGSTIHGSVRMPANWDAGTVTFTHVYLQTAADTGVLNGDISAQCKGNGEAVSSTYGTEIAIDDAAVVGSGSNDMTTSAAVTANGTCAAGDMLYWKYQVDAGGTTTAVATLHNLAFILNYSEVGPSQ